MKNKLLKNKLLINIVLAVLSYLFAYLLVSFVVIEFNPAKMSEESRFVIAAFGTIFCLFIFVYNTLNKQL